MLLTYKVDLGTWSKRKELELQIDLRLYFLASFWTRKSSAERTENLTSLVMLVPSNVQPVRDVKFNRVGVRIVSLQPYHNFCHAAVIEKVRFRYSRHLPNLLRKIKLRGYRKGYNDLMYPTIIMLYETNVTH